MAAEDQGIMSLPMEDQAAAQPMSQMPLEQSYDAVSQGLQNASPQAAADIQQLMATITPKLDQLSDEELDSMLQAVQYLYEGGEAEYPKRLKELIDAGMLDAGDLPEEFDPEVLSAIGTVLLQAVQTRQGAGGGQGMEMPPPEKFARGGIADAARIVAKHGRSGDSILAHISPEEAQHLRQRGGMGTINPRTGLPEFKNIFTRAWEGVTGIVKDTFKAVSGAVKGILKSPVGRILATVALATFLGPGAFGITGMGLGSAAATSLASGAITALGGGNLKQVLTSAATAYFGAPGGAVSQYVGAAGITNAAANAAISSGIVGTGAGLLTGQKLSEAVKSGLTAGAIGGLSTGVTQGFGTQTPGSPANLAPVSDAVPSPVGAQTSPVMPQSDFAPTPLPPIGAEGVAAAPAPMAAPVPMAAPSGPVGAMATPPAGLEGAVGAMGPQSTPTAMDSLSRTAGGIGDLMQGKEGAWDTVKQGASDLFFPKSMGPQELVNTPEYKALVDAKVPPTEALKIAGQQLNPGMLRQYGPLAAAGVGVMGLAGGFKPNPMPKPSLVPSTRGQDLINQDPSKYLVQNMPGVQYDAAGHIIGGARWNPSASMSDVQAAPVSYGGGIPSVLPQGMYGSAAPLGNPQTAQPWNNPYMYNPYLQQPMTAAAGGLASLASGGYPRKTGAISGPGTETSDSIPAMLSDGEFVMTAKAVKGLGGGSRRAGAKKMYALMHQLERNASRG